MRTFQSIIAVSAILLAACSSTAGENTNGGALSSISLASSKSSIRETSNVSYKGTVRAAGISIFMEGTHRLELDSGKFVLLESNVIDLNGYVGESVEVFGSIRPTTESDAVIMSVSEISLIKQSSISSLSSSSNGTSSSESSTDESSVESSAISSSEESSEETSVSNSSSATSLNSSNNSSVASSLSSTTQVQYSAEFEDRIVAMAAEDVAPARWTQEYCTSHIGFCMPVHKNWWFQSFGATATDFWHVEMSTEPLDTIHDGPIAIRLIAGTLASIQAEDGSVVQKGNIVTGYRSWTDGRHFEISADARLESSVRYITDKLEVYTEE